MLLKEHCVLTEQIKKGKEKLYFFCFLNLVLLYIYIMIQIIYQIKTGYIIKPFLLAKSVHLRELYA